LGRGVSSFLNLSEQLQFWNEFILTIYYLFRPTEIILGSFYVDQNNQVVEMINPRVFTHSFSYLNQTLAEKTERFATIFDCEIINPLAIKVKTRATLRTVFALSINPLV